MGLLQVTGKIDLKQFWPNGESDADTTKVIVETEKDAFKFQPSTDQPFTVTQVFEDAKVIGSSAKQAIDKKGRISVRLQGIDAPELHYAPTPISRKKKVTEEQRNRFKELNEEYRQYLGETATVELHNFLGQSGNDSLPCLVTSIVNEPNEVFDTYARFVGDLVVQIDRNEVNVNRWLLQEGWAFPTFYSSMAAEEIQGFINASKQGREKKKSAWSQLQDNIGKLNQKLIYRGKGANPDPAKDRGPLKMFWHFDHRWGSYEFEERTTGRGLAKTPLERYQDPAYTVMPRYWVAKDKVDNRLINRTNKNWLLSFRDVTSAKLLRTCVFSILPKVAVGHTAPILLTNNNNSALVSCLVASLNSLIFDFVARQKIGGTHLTFSVFRQLPVLPPEAYTQEDIEFISSRVLELVYTAWDLQPFAQDMGYDGEPFIWNSERRALLRTELDAYYVKLYGLTRDELRYILDPADVYGSDFPSETFRVLKNNEIKQFGEYRTQRLVLEAWDKMFK